MGHRFKRSRIVGADGSDLGRAKPRRIILTIEPDLRRDRIDVHVGDKCEVRPPRCRLGEYFQLMDRSDLLIDVKVNEVEGKLEKRLTT